MQHHQRRSLTMALAAIVRDMMAAAPPEEPVAQELLSPVRWSPAALEQAHVIMAARRQTVHVGNPHWRKRPARRRADLEDHSGSDDAGEPPQVLSRTPIRTPSRSAMRKQMPTGVALWSSDRVSGWHQHSGMMPSGRLQSRQCWHLCR